VEFTVDGGETVEEVRQVDEGVEMGRNEVPGGRRSEKLSNGVQDAVDFTPPEYISGIITESGVLTPSAVSEELIKIWF